MVAVKHLTLVVMLLTVMVTHATVETVALTLVVVVAQPDRIMVLADQVSLL
jgi:hypothetical protein